MQHKTKVSHMIGSTYTTRHNGDFVVTGYKNSKEVIIEFCETGYIKVVNKKAVSKGCIRDPYYPSVYGVGFCGEGPYPATYKRRGKQFITPAYAVWKARLKAVYGNVKSKHVYDGTSFCNEWRNFQNFAEWFYKQVKKYGKGGYVDKDLLFLGNRVYSPVTCCYVPPAINTLFTGNTKGYKGIHQCKNGKWEASVGGGKKGVTKYLGMYESSEVATQVYKDAKMKHVRDVAIKYQDKLDEALFYKLYTGPLNYINYYMDKE